MKHLKYLKNGLTGDEKQKTFNAAILEEIYKIVDHMDVTALLYGDSPPLINNPPGVRGIEMRMEPHKNYHDARMAQVDDFDTLAVVTNNLAFLKSFGACPKDYS